MGEERIIVRSKNWQQKREVQYWNRLLNITESEALADTKNKPVDTPPAPAADKKGRTTAPVSGTTRSKDRAMGG